MPGLQLTDEELKKLMVKILLHVIIRHTGLVKDYLREIKADALKGLDPRKENDTLSDTLTRMVGVLSVESLK